MEDILIPLGFFAMIAGIVIAPRYFRSQERQKLQETLRAAIEKGQAIPPEVVAAIISDTNARRPTPSPQRDLRRGVVWLAIGVGLLVAGLLLGMSQPDATYPMMAIATIPALIGAAFLTLFFLNRNKV